MAKKTNAHTLRSKSKGNGRGKGTRDLGKWVNGLDGRITGKYRKWRKARRKMARASRQRNRK